MTTILTRRALVGSLAAGAGTILSGCDRLGQNEQFRALLASGERGNYAFQRLLQDRTALAEEFAPSQRSPVFRANGTRMPGGTDYARHLAVNFNDWRLVVDGAVANPQAFSLDQIRAMPTRTQITRHDCVEGWSAIAKWHGVPLKLLLDRAGVSPQARFIVFHCADPQTNGTMYYESIDRIDAIPPCRRPRNCPASSTRPCMNICTGNCLIRVRGRIAQIGRARLNSSHMSESRMPSSA